MEERNGLNQKQIVEQEINCCLSIVSSREWLLWCRLVLFLEKGKLRLKKKPDVFCTRETEKRNWDLRQMGTETVGASLPRLLFGVCIFNREEKTTLRQWKCCLVESELISFHPGRGPAAVSSSGRCAWSDSLCVYVLFSCCLRFRQQQLLPDISHRLDSESHLLCGSVVGKNHYLNSSPSMRLGIDFCVRCGDF